MLEVVEVVVVRAALDLLDIVAAPPEPPTVALPVGCPYADSVALLDLPGVEWRVDVDEPRELLWEGREHVRVVAEDDLLHGAPTIRPIDLDGKPVAVRFPQPATHDPTIPGRSRSTSSSSGQTTRAVK